MDKELTLLRIKDQFTTDVYFKLISAVDSTVYNRVEDNLEVVILQIDDEILHPIRVEIRNRINENC